MTKSIIYSEKVIGALQIIFGTFVLFVFFFGLKNLYELGITYYHLTWEKISILRVIRIYHAEFIFGTLIIISGLLLLLNKKSGWMLTVITSFVTGMLGGISLLNLYFIPGKVESNKTETTVLDLIILVVFFSISFILLSKPFKTKYNPTKRTWYTIIITVALLLGDKMFF